MITDLGIYWHDSATISLIQDDTALEGLSFAELAVIEGYLNLALKNVKRAQNIKDLKYLPQMSKDQYS
jgi:hypothetical protein